MGGKDKLKTKKTKTNNYYYPTNTMPLTLLIGRYSEVKNSFKRDINFNVFRNAKGTLK